MVIGSRGSYDMFEIEEISGERAFLRSPLLLEPGEALTLELSFADGSTMKIPAVVETAADGTNGEPPGIRVSFTRGDDRKAIAAKL